jgi:Ca2+-binding EF-hand superfamily protein
VIDVLSDLKRRKFTNYFKLLDHDHDGALEREDFESIARSAAVLRGIAIDSPAFEAMETVIMLTWAHTQEFTDSDRDGKVTVEEWLQTLEATIASEEQYAVYVTPFAVGLFDLLDADSDGAVGAREYRAFLECFGSSGDGAEENFKRLDTNGDGALTKDEALQLVREFHMSDNPNDAGNWLFGPF